MFDIHKTTSIKNIDIYKDFNGYKLIHLIIIHNKTKLLNQYIKYNLDFNVQDNNLDTPLHLLLNQFYNPKLFISILKNKNIASNIIWNNNNNNDLSILQSILSNNTLFNLLNKFHYLFMNHDTLDAHISNYQYILEFLSPQNIIKYIHLLQLNHHSNPPLFYLSKNKNIKSLSKFIKQLSNNKLINLSQINNITNSNGDNLLGYLLFLHKHNIKNNTKIQNEIIQLLDLGFSGNYINPLNGTQPIKYLILYSDNNFTKKFIHKTNIDFDIIDNYGHNLNTFTHLYYNKFNKKHDDLLSLINSKSNNIFKSYGNKNKSNDFKLIIYKNVDSNIFRARFDDILLYFYLLQKKYNKILSIPTYKNISSLNLDFEFNQITLPTQLDITNDKIPFFISFLDKDNYYIHPYLNIIISSAKTKYSIVFLSIQSHDDNLHANILLYDHYKKHIQRFEPYGNTFILDNGLDDILLEELTWNNNYTYLKPSNITKSTGIQSLSDDTNIVLQKPGDFGGFCLAWCIWFIEMVMINQDIPYNKIIQKTIQKIKSKNITIVEYIRSYGSKLTKDLFKIYKQINLPKNIWTNINFLQTHYDIILQFILQHIL